ncbi:MAG: hypothetical protein KME40_32540 [Komarekiella atlantica HA4396-MV6]|jgi:hypothetical protein|nr:hypothetical protein [Komarekiella atlantica HA4396-MV6]
MSAQTVESELLVDLSIEQMELLSGGKQKDHDDHDDHHDHCPLKWNKWHKKGKHKKHCHYILDPNASHT